MRTSNLTQFSSFFKIIHLHLSPSTVHYTNIISLPHLDLVACYDLIPAAAELLAGRLCLPHAFMLISCLAYFSTLKMEAACSSETPVDFQRTTWRYIPEDRTLHNHRCENLKSLISQKLIKRMMRFPAKFSMDVTLVVYLCNKLVRIQG
jgi:hypothetical protein